MAYKRKKAAQIIFDVPSSSDLPERIQDVSERTGLSYSKLLQKWLTQEENVVGSKRREDDLLKWTRNIENQLNDLQRRMLELQGKPAGDEDPESERHDNQVYRQALLERIKSLRDEGTTLKKIAEQFNSEGVSTLTGTGQWYASSISHILKTR
jgi:DNA-binding transcriptional MerR regulator